MVLVSCDLWAMPGGLADRVAELLASDDATRHLGRAQVVLAATHTHHSPGNYATTPLYNAFASNRSGFDERLFEFLAHRIATAIATAARTAEPATGRWSQLAVGGVARNRSLDAFLLDPEASDFIAQHAHLDVGNIVAHVSHPDAYRAIDPILTIVRFDAASEATRTIGAAAFFAVHPTAMGPRTEVYNSDVFGVATARVEQTLNAGRAADAPRAVVALFNGAQGDVSPNWIEQDRMNTVRIGNDLAAGIRSALQQPGESLSATSSVDVTYRFGRFPIAARRFEPTPGIMRKTAARARPGAASLGGAEDGRTPLFALGWTEGTTDVARGGQGPKSDFVNPWRLEIPWFIRPLFVMDSVPDAPLVFPAGVYRLGDLAIATLPGEFTTMMGHRIGDAVGKAAGIAAGTPVILIGLANEYISYFTTPEEYAAQHYEGGSTIYGADAGTLVGFELTQMAHELTTVGDDPARHFVYDSGPQHRFDVSDVGEAPHDPDDNLANVVQDLTTGRPVRSFPQFVWSDGMPEWRKPYDGAVTPTVLIEQQGNDGRWVLPVVDSEPQDDSATSLVTVALSAAPPTSQWAAIWMTPGGTDLQSAYRFRVRGLAQQSLCSQAFRLSPLPGLVVAAPCT
jgi:neutral ceramidase